MEGEEGEAEIINNEKIRVSLHNERVMPGGKGGLGICFFFFFIKKKKKKAKIGRIDLLDRLFSS